MKTHSLHSEQVVADALAIGVAVRSRPKHAKPVNNKTNTL
jgi:hypothetical protein